MPAPGRVCLAQRRAEGVDLVAVVPRVDGQSEAANVVEGVEPPRNDEQAATGQRDLLHDSCRMSVDAHAVNEVADEVEVIGIADERLPVRAVRILLNAGRDATADQAGRVVERRLCRRLGRVERHVKRAECARADDDPADVQRCGRRRRRHR